MTDRVWISPDGKCYHRDRECRLVKFWLRHRMVLVTREQAQRMGRGPCVGRLCYRDRFAT